MTLKHSPGPFAYNTWDGECIILDAEGNCIADLIQSRHHGDGHLFAAAPDMLRLLRVLVETHYSGEGGKQTWLVLNDALNETHELIARLDGDTCPDK